MYPGAGFAVLTRLRCFLFAGFQNMLEIRITSSCMDAQLSEFSCRYILEAILQQYYERKVALPARNELTRGRRGVCNDSSLPKHSSTDEISIVETAVCCRGHYLLYTINIVILILSFVA